MLTQGPAPDPRFELNITSFLTLPDPLHCLICGKNIMNILLLFQVMGVWEGWWWFIYVKVWVGRQGCLSYFFYFFFFSVFVLLVIVLSWLVHDSLLCLFNCSFFALFVCGPFNN